MLNKKNYLYFSLRVTFQQLNIHVDYIAWHLNAGFSDLFCRVIVAQTDPVLKTAIPLDVKGENMILFLLLGGIAILVGSCGVLLQTSVAWSVCQSVCLS